VVIRVLRSPPIIRTASARLLALSFPAEALFVGILRRGKKGFPAMMALSFPAAFHPATIASGLHPNEENQIKKIRKKRFFQKFFEEDPEE
jgi:hypothetical protein